MFLLTRLPQLRYKDSKQLSIQDQALYIAYLLLRKPLTIQLLNYSSLPLDQLFYSYQRTSQIARSRQSISRIVNLDLVVGIREVSQQLNSIQVILATRDTQVSSIEANLVGLLEVLKYNIVALRVVEGVVVVSQARDQRYQPQ